ncbi:hypothetical protein M5D96_007791 [Drosophila gunungcola]|uniref:Uncharacterized protein n=1 Tax=Drosophila gunungcola TaxID=103775 RepID=A0A9P9YLH6_9MUSC|nr:hypothetical protein M5D96_007791 [Drosophila gunungcola]
MNSLLSILLLVMTIHLHIPPSSYDHSPPQHPSSSYDHPEQHPSSSYDHSPPQHPSSSYEQPPQDHSNNYKHQAPSSTYDQPPQHPPTNYISSDSHTIQSYPQDEYAPPSQELPLNPHHKFPSFDFPKSSYEVPIYDPVPFEASTRDEQESYPPILASSPDHNEIASDAHAAGSSKRRKRKRKPSAGIVPAKHTLDVPELQQAYDADGHSGHSGESNENADTDTNSSHFVERKQTFFNFVTPTTTTTTSTTAAPWSPMRGRSSTTRTAFLPTLVTSTPETPTTGRSRNRGASRYRTNPQPVNPDPITTEVRIDQSHSQSYYDGTIAPPTRQQFSPTTGVRGSRPTRPGYVRTNHGPVSPLALQPADPGRGAPTSKRTTKGVFDTTLFKSPLSDREMERNLHGLRQNLPKNHKLY